ncbi:uncharacterized protein LOC127258996 [Andrographis paniculata]|uniref:uncharacterized protein LOC127258996 n=1 Tax=Andrographis paniculata TaxID=175694 RepID=UPI0021E8DB24|nr:uncharacterized protein LOC127258996 [Andrographis paniculata]
MHTSDIFKHLLISILLLYVIFNSIPNEYSPFNNFNIISPIKFRPSDSPSPPSSSSSSPTTLAHLAFGLVGSAAAWGHRRPYIESWWRPNATRGFLYLDKPPTGPWSEASPPYRVSENLTAFLAETKAAAPVAIRIVHAIMEAVRDADDGNLRWVVMGDDDSIFFVDNILDMVAGYDHRKYYYFGTPSEFVMSNFWFSFVQGFGGAGFVLSYPLAKAMADDMEKCLRRSAHINAADLITMVCAADVGVSLSPHKGFHQIDMHGDISGLLSAHPPVPILSLHHFDHVDPIFPGTNRSESARRLMKAAAAADQSRMMQQTICHHKQNQWSFSVAWGYSAHIYEKIMPRWHLQKPLETFKIWVGQPRPPPQFMFNTRPDPSKDPCEAPHLFFFTHAQKTPAGILTTYSRHAPRGLPPCSSPHSVPANNISEIHVLSPPTKRTQMDRAECCDVVLKDDKAEVTFRECFSKETIVV